MQMWGERLFWEMGAELLPPGETQQLEAQAGLAPMTDCSIEAARKGPRHKSGAPCCPKGRLRPDAEAAQEPCSDNDPADQESTSPCGLAATWPLWVAAAHLALLVGCLVMGARA